MSLKRKLIIADISQLVTLLPMDRLTAVYSHVLDEIEKHVEQLRSENDQREASNTELRSELNRRKAILVSQMDQIREEAKHDPELRKRMLDAGFLA